MAPCKEHIAMEEPELFHYRGVREKKFLLIYPYKSNTNYYKSGPESIFAKCFPKQLQLK